MENMSCTQEVRAKEDVLFGSLAVQKRFFSEMCMVLQLCSYDAQVFAPVHQHVIYDFRISIVWAAIPFAYQMDYIHFSSQ